MLAVAAGGALGAVARHLCGLAALALTGEGFPWGTLAVNLAGSFLIALYATATALGGRHPASATQRHFVMAGFCGGFTTFSLFSLEVLTLAGRGEAALAAAYAGMSLLLWLGGAWAGDRVGRRWGPGA